MAAKNICKILLDAIDKFVQIKFCKDENKFILLKFNETKVFKIVFGSVNENSDEKSGSAKVLEKAATSTALAPESKAFVLDLKINSKAMLVIDLLKFSISSRENKNRANELLFEIARLAMMHHDIIIKTGKDFMEKASKAIVIFDSKQKYEKLSDGKNWVQPISENQNHDNAGEVEKIQGKEAILAVLGALTMIAVLGALAVIVAIVVGRILL